ncbi:MAG: hypothetical protein IT173_14725, partial [Acidobacteria bacterium]|nr:hypothetical protein [Acidobacteriota bacterium]
MSKEKAVHIFRATFYHWSMVLRAFGSFVLILTLFIILPAYDGAGYFILRQEPLIRIGLSTNANSVSITTADSQLVAYSPEEASRYLATNRISVSARAYRPPEVENYRFEIQNIETSAEAEDVAKDVRETTEQSAITSIDPATNK